MLAGRRPTAETSAPSCGSTDTDLRTDREQASLEEKASTTLTSDSVEHRATDTPGPRSRNAQQHRPSTGHGGAGGQPPRTPTTPARSTSDGEHAVAGHRGPGSSCPNGRSSGPWRSTVSTLLIAVVRDDRLGAMFAAITANQPTGFEPGATAISTSLTGTFFAQLAVGVLGCC